MDFKRIVAELKIERDRLGMAIAALEGLDLAKAMVRPTAVGTTTAPRAVRRRGRITPEGRRRLSELMKKRWAERRRRAASNQRN